MFTGAQHQPVLQNQWLRQQFVCTCVAASAHLIWKHCTVLRKRRVKSRDRSLTLSRRVCTLQILLAAEILFSVPFGSDCSLALIQSYCLLALCFLKIKFHWFKPPFLLLEAPVNHGGSCEHVNQVGMYTVPSVPAWWKGLFLSPLSVKRDFLHPFLFSPNFLSSLACSCLFPLVTFCLILPITSIIHFFFSVLFKHWSSFHYSLVIHKHTENRTKYHTLAHYNFLCLLNTNYFFNELKNITILKMCHLPVYTL